MKQTPWGGSGSHPRGPCSHRCPSSASHAAAVSRSSAARALAAGDLLDRARDRADGGASPFRRRAARRSGRRASSGRRLGNSQRASSSMAEEMLSLEQARAATSSSRVVRRWPTCVRSGSEADAALPGRRVWGLPPIARSDALAATLTSLRSVNRKVSAIIPRRQHGGRSAAWQGFRLSEDNCEVLL